MNFHDFYMASLVLVFLMFHEFPGLDFSHLEFHDFPDSYICCSSGRFPIFSYSFLRQIFFYSYKNRIFEVISIYLKTKTKVCPTLAGQMDGLQSVLMTTMGDYIPDLDQFSV